MNTGAGIVPKEPIIMLPSEETDIQELHRMLNLGTPTLLGPGDERLDLPDSVYHLLKDVVVNMMQGKSLVLVPRNDKMTTQAAANFLGFSRPHFIKLLKSGAIPYEKVGQHRRVAMEDLLIYSKNRDAERRAGLNELAREEYKEGAYEGLAIPEGGSDE